MTQDIQDATAMIAHGWEPIEYRSPEKIDGQHVFIQWNGMYGQWTVLEHPTITHSSKFPTALDAVAAINNAKPE